ncbi:hypothetical protein Cgig2_004333 [Carnegiea gigantea]|uniref:Uncharacterized protein n=1 Tax=Carnegiea gigantea TaxID=171969 RepID=A0A9Q1Q9I1_9CARY|nr:hypothetical protein Cgig2_004333 [Carnegiea gigantea]
MQNSDGLKDPKSTSGNQEEQQNERIMKGDFNAEFKKWLNGSLVCTSEEPKDLRALATVLISDFRQCTKICSLSKFKFILTFPSIEQMEGVLGRVLCLGKSIDNSDSFEFESMKVLIDTDILRTINREIVMLKNCAQRGWFYCTGYSEGHTTSTSSMEAMDSNHEEKDDDLASDDDVACSELRRNDKMARTTEEEAVQETSNFEIDLENVEGNGKFGGRYNGNINSNTRTNTVCFSQNGYSEEILKLEQDLPPLEGQNQEESDSLSQALGFESPIKLDLAIHEAMEKSKEGKKTTKRSKRILEESKRTLNKRRRVSTSSGNTSERKEYLKIGKLLGMTVIENENAASKRITRSLKKSKIIIEHNNKDLI